MAERDGARKAPGAPQAPTMPRTGWMQVALAVLLLGGTPLAVAGTGRFLVEYGPVATQDYSEYESVLREGRVLENVAGSLNRTLLLPRDVVIRVAECGESTASWKPATSTVLVCYELLQAVLEVSVAATDEADESRADRWFSGAATFIVFHQLGHALTDVLGLSGLPSPELAADQFALVALGGAVGQPQEVRGALEFMHYAVGSESAAGLGFLEEHGYDSARVERLACGFAGAMPAALPWFEELHLLRAGSTSRCGEEFAGIDRQWDERLAPWLRLSPRTHQSSVAGLERNRFTP